MRTLIGMEGSRGETYELYGSVVREREADVRGRSQAGDLESAQAAIQARMSNSRLSWARAHPKHAHRSLAAMHPLGHFRMRKIFQITEQNHLTVVVRQTLDDLGQHQLLLAFLRQLTGSARVGGQYLFEAQRRLNERPFQ